VLRAAHAAAVPAEERGRPLAEYMILPASQYSVLARRTERLGDDSFRCHVGELRLFNLRVEPVLTLRVDVGPRGPTVRLLGTRLEGSRAAVAANDRFSATLQNEVRWREAAGGGGALELASDAEIQVSVEVPGWFALPVSVLERTGESCAASRATRSRSPACPALCLRPLLNASPLHVPAGSAVMKRVLTAAVPRFLAQLRADYEIWAAGAEEQRAVGSASSGDD
jgi:hypothetical protein